MRHVRCSLLLIVLCWGVQASPLLAQNVMKDFASDWKKVESLENEGLPRSAVALVDSIFAEAQAAGNSPQLIKALLYQSKYKTQLEEDAVNQVLADVRSVMAEAEPDAAAVLHSILAELYWRFYQNNRWRFQNRTEATTYDENDLLTWDLKTIIEQTTHEYLASVEPRDMLQNVQLERYRALIHYTAPQSLRPTLYDFLAHRAIDFFENTEAGLVTPEKAVQITSEAYFAPAAQFVTLDGLGTDASLPAEHALQLFQHLLAFHLERDDTDAFLDADLRRLDFVYRHAVVPEKDQLYIDSLERLRSEYADMPFVAQVTYILAQQYNQRGDRYRPGGTEDDRLAKRKAYALCAEALENHPQSKGAQNCRALRTSLEHKSLNIQVAEANVPGQPALARIEYRNLSRLHVKLVRTTEAARKRFEQANWRNRPGLLQAFARQAAEKQFPVTLPDDGDFQQHSVEIAIPPLAPSVYVLLAGTASDFSTQGEALAYAFVQVSPISYVVRQLPDGDYDLLVLHRESGAPLSGATVRLSYQEGGLFQLGSRTFTTDETGYVRLSPRKQRSFIMEIAHDGEVLYARDNFYSYDRATPPPARLVTQFFTDRAIYRPGQTIYFKGLIMQHDGDKAFEIAPRQRTRVVFRDVNYQEIAALDLVANEYGTFSGTFTAPQGVLNGQMTIHDSHGSTSFSVEDYKRPRFEVTMERPEGVFLAGDSVEVAGTARSFAGATLDGADVTYRVVRTPRWHHWNYYRWGQPPPQQEVEIARGTVEADADGRFVIPFVAKPDLAFARETNPQFSYRITADVADLTGETQSAETWVVAGYTALYLTLSLPNPLDKTTDTPATITAQTLNGAPKPVQGTLKVYRLTAPDRYFRPELWQDPDRTAMTERSFHEAFPHDDYGDEENWESWPIAETALTMPFDTGDTTRYALPGLDDWRSGAYRFEVEAEDPTGQTLKIEQNAIVFSPDDRRPPIPQYGWLHALKSTGEPGETASFLLGSSAEEVRVLFEIERGGEITESRWLNLSNEVERIDMPLQESDRGNFGVHVTFVKHNRAFRQSQTVSVPWTNKQLQLSLATFRDRLKPGAEETWKMTIRGPQGEAAAAELVASMYDASLDQFRPHGWYLNVLRYNYARLSWNEQNLRNTTNTQLQEEGWNPSVGYVSFTYPQLNWFGFYYFGEGRRFRAGRMDGMVAEMAAPAPTAARNQAVEAEESLDEIAVSKQSTADQDAAAAPPPAAPGADTPPAGLENVQARRNLNETAFFFPHLETNEAGEIVFSFTMPEALTRWKMLALAHTKDLETGTLTQEVVTQKELMVTPGAPRFFREGDTIRFTAKVANLSDTLLTGQAQLFLFDARTMRPIDARLGNTDATRRFSVDESRSTGLAWTLNVPQGSGIPLEAITYRVVAEAGAFSDGEEAALPVLPNRMLVTETLPLPVRGGETKQFTFDKLLNTTSPTLDTYRLTLEYTPNPIWYAVQALPYLMEFPHECTEQTFSRFYANSIATHIVRQNPEIERIYEQWRAEGADALVSNLEKNQELKALLLEATPWVLQAKSETERKRRIALLFDVNHMKQELGAALLKLEQQQQSNGAWSWFPGMRPDRYITQHIVAGLGHLHGLGVLDPATDDRTAAMITRALRYLDVQVWQDYDRLLETKADLDLNHLSRLHIQYLYTRSFFPQTPFSDRQKEAFDYYFGQAQKFWLQNNNYLQGMIALALHRYDDGDTPGKIIASLREFALHDDELGMYWKREAGYYWYQAPVETQALLIEAFHEIAGDRDEIEEMKQWLLKQKQTQDWGTTKATAEATYALLLQGTDLLTEQATAVIRLGDTVVDTGKLDGAEAGTGYVKTSWDGAEVSPEMGEITVAQQGESIGWGAVYWQYFEQLDNITPAETPLSLEKSVFLRTVQDTGELLVPVEEATLTPGDLLTIRVTLRTDRDLEYVHLQDMRAAGLEPTNVLSGYRYQDGLGYYKSTRDAATHFFFGWLPKGTYVFEYPLRVMHAGDFSNGISTVQCMYAPEFAAHSEGIRLQVATE